MIDILLLKNDLDIKTKEFEELEQQFNELTIRNETSETKLKELEESFEDRLEKILDDKDDIIEELKEKLDDKSYELSDRNIVIEEIQEEKEEILKLLKEFWLSQERQTSFDKQIHELLEGKIDNYQTPYFLKPL